MAVISMNRAGGRQRGGERPDANGWRRAELDAQTRIGELARQLSELHRLQEEAKLRISGLAREAVGASQVKSRMLAKLFTLVRGESAYELYASGLLSAVRAQTLELKFPAGLCGELRSILFGTMEDQVPEVIRLRLAGMWDTAGLDEAKSRIAYCRSRLPEQVARRFEQAALELSGAVHCLYELRVRENGIRSELRTLYAV